MIDIDYINKTEKYYLKPGYVMVTKNPMIITSVLGSCISVCLYDISERYGGMNHYIFPFRRNEDINSTKYGDIAMYTLIKSFIEFGSDINNLYATIIGGAHIDKIKDSELISEDNINISKQILKKYNIKVAKEITGGINGRKIEFYTELNEIKITVVKKIDPDYFFNLGKF